MDKTTHIYSLRNPKLSDKKLGSKYRRRSPEPTNRISIEDIDDSDSTLRKQNTAEKNESKRGLL